MYPLILGAAAAGLLLLTIFCVCRLRRARGRRRFGWTALSAFTSLLLIIAALGAGYSYWYTHRTQPAARDRELFTGIRHIVETTQTPRPMVIHIVRIDLRAPNISFLVTPGQDKPLEMVRGRTTSAFVREFKLQAAINANYFFPFRSNSMFDYYPHTGDPVELCGFAASRGNVYSPRRWNPGTLFISETNQASFEEPIGPVYNAISGNGFVVREGIVQSGLENGDKPYPRCGLGLDAGRRYMTWFIIDGKQPGYSEGATLEELGAVMLRHGVHEGIRLDEGGSSTIAAGKSDGGARVLNSPINHRVPKWERVVANHLGVYAK